MRKIICKLSDTDTYSKAGFSDVFLNNPRFFKNTLWNKRKKQLQTVPHFFQDEALDLYYISLIVFYLIARKRGLHIQTIGHVLS